MELIFAYTLLAFAVLVLPALSFLVLKKSLRSHKSHRIDLKEPHTIPKKKQNPVGTIIFLGLIAWGLAWGFGTHQSIVTQSIPCQYRTVNDNTLILGQRKISQLCVNGTRTIVSQVSNWDGTTKSITSDSVSIAPQDEITLVGTKPIPPIYVGTTSGGTLCSDGWVSPSTGRGTCSHHGGEAH